MTKEAEAAARHQDKWAEQDWEDAISKERARLDEAPLPMQRLPTE